MKLDATHPTTLALKDLLPVARISGGSFAHWLPHPRRISPKRRPGVFNSAQNRAVLECVQGLVSFMGLEPATRVPSGRDGQRLWPDGYVGSMTHKGTVVLGAVALKVVLESIGIDLERLATSELRSLEEVIAPEGLPAGPDPSVGTLLAFSAKEAVFKAFYSVQPTRLAFRDVRLRWKPCGGGRYEANAELMTFRSYRVQCQVVGDWIVSAATCKSHPEGARGL